MLVVQLVVPIVVASALLARLVLTGKNFKWSDIQEKAKLMGLPMDHLDTEQCPISFNIKDLTKEEVDHAEAWIRANHKHGKVSSKGQITTAPNVASLTIGAPNPDLGIGNNPIVYNYINLNSQRWTSPSIFVDPEDAKAKILNLRLNKVEFRDEAESRRVMHDNPFCRQVLKQMRDYVNLVRKPEAKMIYEFTGENLELWNNFASTGKIPLAKVDSRLLSKYDLVNHNFPFIQPFNLQRDANKMIDDFDDWMREQQASSSHS